MKVDADSLLDAVAIAACQGTYGISIVPEEDGWGLWSRSDSKISAVQVKLLAEAFPDGYEQSEGFTIKHTFFQDALLPGTTPDITYGDGKITIVTDKRKQTMRLDGQDPDEAVKAMPTYTPEATMAIEADELIRFFKQKQIKDFKGVNGVKLFLSEEGLTAVTANDISSFEDLLPCDTVAVPEDKTSAHFNVDALIPMIMCMPKGALVTLGFDQDCPIELTISTEKIQARLLLAPMVVDE